MASTGDPELKDGFMSAWMKAKPGSARDIEPFAASPPSHDESFFYIRYPKPDNLFGKPKTEVGKILQNSQAATPFQTATVLAGKEKDWSKHTKPCREVLHGITPISTAVNPAAAKPKPAGTDDGFKGEGAACGSSVVKVAHKMISSTRTPSQRGFTVASIDDDTPADGSSYNYMARRGSKSLPVSPATSPPGSPNSRRRRNGNRYFTSPFEPSDDMSHRSWLTMALLGYKKDLANSTSTLAEEDGLEARLQGSSLMQSVESLGPAPRHIEPAPQPKELPSQQPKLAKPASAFRPKPSELREMNFWSPTSM